MGRSEQSSLTRSVCGVRVPVGRLPPGAGRLGAGPRPSVGRSVGRLIGRLTRLCIWGGECDAYNAGQCG